MAKDSINYKKLTEELDVLINNLRSPEIDLDDAILKYERGMAIIKLLEQYLKQAENKVEAVKKSFK